MAHAAIADHGLVPDFAKGSDPFVRLVAAGHSIAAACESLHPDAKPGSASTSVFPDGPSSRDHRPLSPRPQPPRAGRVAGRTVEACKPQRYQPSARPATMRMADPCAFMIDRAEYVKRGVDLANTGGGG